MKYAPVCSYMKYRNIDLGLISGSESSPGEGNVYPVPYFCLENSLDRGAWRTTLAPCEESYDQPRQCFQKQRHRFAGKGLRSQREQPRQGSRLITGATWMETGGGVHVHNCSNLNHRKQDMMHSPATGKEGDAVTPREGREAGRCQCHMTSLQVWSENAYKWTSFKKRHSLKDLEGKLPVTKKVRCGAGRNELLQTNICTQPYLK